MTPPVFTAALRVMVQAAAPHGVSLHDAGRVAANALSALLDDLYEACDSAGVTRDVAESMFAALGGGVPSRNVESPIDDTEASRAIRDAEVLGVGATEAALMAAERDALQRRGVIRGACGEFSVWPATAGQMAVWEGE